MNGPKHSDQDTDAGLCNPGRQDFLKTTVCPPVVEYSREFQGLRAAAQPTYVQDQPETAVVRGRPKLRWRLHTPDRRRSLGTSPRLLGECRKNTLV
jgi:hypothetical protein